MNMDSIKNVLNNQSNKLEYGKKVRKGKEYRYLWVRVNFAVAKDGYIKRVGARAFGVFMVIRTFMDKEGIAYPSLATIAHLSGCSIGTVKKEISALCNANWLKKVGRVVLPSGKFGNTKYRILEKDLVRGTGQEGFMRRPLANNTYGD